MIDLTAPIVPGVEAAGLRLYQKLTAIPGGLCFESENGGEGLPTRMFYHRSENVRILTFRNVILEVSVYGHYLGKWLDDIGVGSTLEDVAGRIGPWEEDEDDRLVIQGVPGLHMEVEWAMRDPAFASKPISEFTVFDPAPDSLWNLRWWEVNLERQVKYGSIDEAEFTRGMAEVSESMKRRGFDSLLDGSPGP